MEPNQPEVGPSSGLSFPVVGLGASAGGLEALIRCFEHLPTAPDMAFVVILHLSPEHESNAAAILQRSTKMAVLQVKEATKIERNHVYVIPPSRSLLMYDGHLALVPSQRDRGRHIAIDLFFRTLAEAHKERAVGVILSGTGSDGAVGLASIKEYGGIVVAQSPNDAEHRGMPDSAIATGKVDFVLPVTEIPQKLIDLWANARKIELPFPTDSDLKVLAPESPQAAEEALRGILALLHKKTGHDFKHYKRATVLRRIERRLQVNNLRTLPAYLDFLDRQATEAPALLNDMLIGVTNFFRDRDSFEALERDVVPRLFEPPLDEEGVRAWVAGCSTGEEAFSLAILLSDALSRSPTPRPIQVFASDIDEASLASARLGKYPEAIVTDVPPTYLRDYFTRIDSGYQANESIRKRVLFAAHNLLRDPPFSRLDLVLCRNLLIYLDREVQRDILQMFHFALRSGGYLFLGSSETADAAPGLFEPIDRRHRIYRAAAEVRSSRRMPAFPLGGRIHHATTRPGVTMAPKGLKPPTIAELHMRGAFDDDTTGTVVVDRALDILHTSPGASQFLQFTSGDPSRQLLSVANPEIRAELRLALFEFSKSQAKVTSPPVRIHTDGPASTVRMTVRPLQSDSPNGLMLVRFVKERVDAASIPSPGDDSALAHLEQALQRKDEQLQATVTQFSTTTEELRSSNEELQALNEELRSASEELETSKEELQSNNEELLTVNVELKAKVEETAQVNDDWQNLLRASEIATVFVDAHMRIKRFTPLAATIFNLINGDVGRSLFDLTHRLEYPDLASDAAETFKTLKMVEREVRSDDGRWFLARLLPYRTGENLIGGAVLNFVDISSRVLAESNMHLGEEQLQLVAQSLPEFAILTLDPDGRITSWSRGAQNLFGYSEAESLGQSFDIIFTSEDRAAGRPAFELERAAAEGRCPDERWHVRKDGSSVFISGVLARLTMGGLQGFAKIAHDITALRQSQDEGTAAIDAAREATRLKDEFLAVMSHELKHPLNLIHINAQLLLNLPETKVIPAIRKASETIERSVATQVRIIDDLLDLSRTQAGKLRLDLSPLELVEALEPSMEWATQQAKNKQLGFVYKAPAEPIYVHADVVRIEQVVMNLLSNALKFTASGGWVEVRLFKAGEEAVLQVIDNGRGIAPAFLPQVFGMFEQEERAASRREGGLGIGLGLARELVVLHGGRIDAASAGAGLGATFTLRLPVHERSDFAPLDHAPEVTNPLQGLRILVVDDDPDGIETLGMLLGIEGAEVTAARSGADALRFCETKGFDLIISDIGMPMMDGSQLIATLRRRPTTERTPAIALTGYGRPQDVKAALTAGFTAHLTKPVNMVRLRELAQELTGQA